MVRTPEQYFQEQDFGLPNAGNSSDLTAAEQSFLQKYVGANGASELGITYTESGDIVIPDIPPLEEELKERQTLQMIFFYVQEQLYTIPIEAVQEVIKYVPAIRLPLSPEYMAGVINLRGRVTPLIQLEQLLCLSYGQVENDTFIIICQRKGMQLGIIVDKIRTMHTVSAADVSWNVEAQIGANAEYLCGILDYNDKIFGVISIDKIIDHIL